MQQAIFHRRLESPHVITTLHFNLFDTLSSPNTSLPPPIALPPAPTYSALPTHPHIRPVFGLDCVV